MKFLKSSHTSPKIYDGHPASSNTYKPDCAAVNHEIRVQSNNTKSRVETQIKLYIQLVSKDGIQNPNWSWLRVNEFMLSKKKINRKSMDRVLDLEASVICDSNPSKKVNMCQGCVRRERKRAQRRKNPTLDYCQRILLFNCEPLIDFSKGEAVLSTRITCYCRHHNELNGFRIQFIMKNDKGIIVATGESSPIMVTDDQKSYWGPSKNKYKPVSFNTGSSHASFQNDNISKNNITCRKTIINPQIAQETMSQSTIYDTTIIPILDTITPRQASTCGGNKVTITGKGFHGNLVLMFGNRAAITICWSTTVIHCILPPAEQPGSVIISFKEYSLIIASQYPPLFHYIEQDSKSILDLALQITGFNQQYTNNTEIEVIHILSQSRCVLDHTNNGGQNLLHLASYFNYVHLIRFLVSRNSNLIFSQDTNGLSALHFSCQTKSTDAICILLKYGSDIALRSSIGTPMELVSGLLALDMSEDETRCSWLPSLFSMSL